MKRKDHFTMTLRGKEMIVIASALQEQLRKLDEAITVITKTVAVKDSYVVTSLHKVYGEIDTLHSRFVDAIHHNDPNIPPEEKTAH
jgi:hypothetical protein